MTSTTTNGNQTTISNGTRHVVIFDQTATGEGVYARKFTGHTDLNHADASPLSWKGKTLAGAIKWAKNQIA